MFTVHISGGRRTRLTFFVLLGVALFGPAWPSAARAQAAERGERRERVARGARISHLEAPGWVEVGASVPVTVTAADERGLAAIEISFGEDRRVVEVGGRTTARVSVAFLTREARLQKLQAIAISLDGTRGTPQTAAVAVSVSDARAGAADPRELLARLSAKRYVRKNGSAPFYGKDPLNKYNPNNPAISAQLGGILGVQGPWWSRWQKNGGPAPFDFKAACGAWISGIDPDGQVLECWLGLHPDVAQHLVWEEVNPANGSVTAKAYPNWTDDQKIELHVAVFWAWEWMHGGLDWFNGEYLFDPPENQITLQDCQYVRTGLTHDAAWKLYLGTVGHSLAVELGGFVPWSVVGYSDADLDILFNSKSLYQAGKYVSPGTVNCANSTFTFIGYVVNPAVIPAPATTTFQFLVDADIIRPDHYKTVGRWLTWARSHMAHIGGSPDTRNMYAYYQYRGDAPASSVWQGTTYVDPDSSYSWGPLSWSPSGCHGVATLSQAVLRLINLPVDANRIDGTGHRAPYFWTIGQTLSHGDDVYDQVSKWHPTWSASLLLISNAQYQDWFVGPNASPNNVERRPYDVTLKLLPNELLQMYCDDLANGKTHATGSVYDLFKWIYSLPTLEAQGLWGNLAVKASQKGYCTTP
jgi:hypothetical protein